MSENVKRFAIFYISIETFGAPVMWMMNPITSREEAVSKSAD